MYTRSKTYQHSTTHERADPDRTQHRDDSIRSIFLIGDQVDLTEIEVDKSGHSTQIVSLEWSLVVAEDGRDDHGLFDRVVTGRQEGVFAGAKGTPKAISKNGRKRGSCSLHEDATVFLQRDRKQLPRQVRITESRITWLTYSSSSS